MSQAEEQSNEAWIELSAIVGPEHLRPATPEDAVDAVQPAGVIAPGNAQEVAQVLRYCASAGLSIIPRGGGTQLGLGNRPRKADFVLSLERLNQVIEHAWGDMTVTVEAGCTIDKLQSVVREHGQQLGADPRQPEQATVGGVLATAESGTLRIRYGAIRDLVLGVEMALPDGSVIKAGGKVVKNVAGYDLTKLAIGSLGTLGVITRAVFRLHPVPRATATFAAMLPTAAEAEKLLLAILDSHLVYTGLQMRARHEDQIFIYIRFEGIPESLARPIRQAGPHCGRSSVCGLRRRCLDGAAEAVRQCRQLGDLQVLCLAFADRLALRCYFPAHQEGWGCSYSGRTRYWACRSAIGCRRPPSADKRATRLAR